MIPLKITPEELRSIFVTDLEMIDAAEFERSRAVATRLRIPLERALVERGRIPASFFLQRVAETWKVGFIDLALNDVMPDALTLVPEEFARRNLLMPLSVQGRELRVAMWDPRNRQAIDAIASRTQLTVVPLLAPDIAIARCHLLYKGDVRAMLERTLSDNTLSLTAGTGAADRSIVDLLNRVLEYAAISRASDIHIEPYEIEVIIRCRVDGVLHEVLTLPQAVLAPLVARIKVLAGMRIDERRIPQDGRFDVDLGGFKIELRASTLPAHWGEKVVLRVVSKDYVHIDLEDLGLVPFDFAIMRRNVLRPFGMVLITGPTGSGKSSSLYAMLLAIGAERQNVVNISTIEDPVERTFPRINQMSVNPMHGVDFAGGLRALLRQDPDVIMVGEIRDRETVEIAVRAALIGRLLLSTLHTNDATSSVTRLLDMGVEPFLIASTLTLVVGQRLVRRICLHCRESAPLDEPELRMLRGRADFDRTLEILRQENVIGAGGDPLAEVRVFRGKGCPQCGWRGFRGRIGVFELFEIDGKIRQLIMDRADAATIRTAAIAGGMKTMFQDGLAKVLLGETTLEEVFRVAI